MVDEAATVEDDDEEAGTEIVGTPPDATPPAPDALGEVELDVGIAGLVELPLPPTIAPTPH